MHIQTIIVFVLVMIATVSVSSVSADLFDCPKCIKAAAKGLFACSKLQVDIDIAFFDNSDNNDGASKECYCALASNPDWLDSCKETCPTTVTDVIKAAIRTPKDNVCKKVSPFAFLKGSAGSLTPPKTHATTSLAVLVAIVASAVQFLF
ncbi:hypothetical protein BGZ65_012820 [Modicella reniformis]|uniref:Transmembrane protein n=1 Tax=Modicella reniformis TaxID=1440133 RepID=A0A9P6MJ97_9FUNG|nr:hypothetical protein BGZ65_012820 [Modicella reniformis]